MSDLVHHSVVVIDGREIVVRELCVADVRKLLKPLDGDLLDAALFEDVRLGDLPLFTNMTSVDVEQMQPSSLRVLVQECKKVNPDFFGMLARLERSRVGA